MRNRRCQLGHAAGRNARSKDACAYRETGEVAVKKIRTFAVGLVAAAISFVGGSDAQVYSLATNPQGSVFYSTGATISKLMVEKTGLQFRVAPYAGSTTYSNGSTSIWMTGMPGFGTVQALVA